MLARLHLFIVSPSGRWGRRGLCCEEAPGFLQTKILRHNIEVDIEMSCSVPSGSPYVVRIVQGSRDRSAGGGHSSTSVQAFSEDQLWSESNGKGNNNILWESTMVTSDEGFLFVSHSVSFQSSPRHFGLLSLCSSSEISSLSVRLNTQRW